MCDSGNILKHRPRLSAPRRAPCAFWAYRRRDAPCVLQTCAEGDMPALIEKVPGFKKHIRVFIVHTLATTFQDSTRENMEQCLDLVSEGVPPPGRSRLSRGGRRELVVLPCIVPGILYFLHLLLVAATSIRIPVAAQDSNGGTPAGDEKIPGVSARGGCGCRYASRSLHSSSFRSRC